MTGMGFAVLTMDYPGVGDSDAVGDPYATTTNMVAAAMLAASRDVIALIREGGINGVEPMPALKCIGLGHSMGALFTVLQQSLNEPYRALVLLGFSTSGLPDKVPPEILAIANDPIKLQKQLPIWARTVFEAPPPVARRDKSFDKTRIVFKNDAADPRGLRALKAIRTKPRLPLPAVEAMLPGKVSLEAACTCVPIFLGVGEHDIAGPAHQLPVAFPASKEITLHVVESAGHSMFPFPSRHRLFTRIASWAKSLD